MKLNIGICDDHREHIDMIKEYVERWADQNFYTVELRAFYSAEQFIIENEVLSQFDILLLDIEMSEMDGVALAKKIRQVDERVIIIFISGYQEYIQEGYEVAALHFLIKPLEEEKLIQVLNRAITKIKKDEKVLNVQTSNYLKKIALSEIKYVEVMKNYVTIHAKEDTVVKRTLSEVEKDLDERFFKISRSYIINLKYVQKSSRKEVVMNNGEVLPLSRGIYEALNRAIISLH